jgi:hypothetical protein
VPSPFRDDVQEVLFTAEQIEDRLDELAAELDRDYAGREVLLIGVLKGAVFLMADLVRRLTVPSAMDFMAVSSYGSATTSSGVVRILKDLDSEIGGKHVLVVEDIVDTGLTLAYLTRPAREATLGGGSIEPPRSGRSRPRPAASGGGAAPGHADGSTAARPAQPPPFRPRRPPFAATPPDADDPRTRPTDGTGPAPRIEVAP